MLHDPVLDVAPVATLDLHGFPVRDVEAALRTFFKTWRERRPGAVVHVITGKGRGSPGLAALRPAVRHLLKQRLAPLVADWALDADEGGYLIKVA